ncbi:unnamed protein product [Ectocarpus fasciculatus]
MRLQEKPGSKLLNLCDITVRYNLTVQSLRRVAYRVSVYPRNSFVSSCPLPSIRYNIAGVERRGWPSRRRNHMNPNLKLLRLRHKSCPLLYLTLSKTRSIHAAIHGRIHVQAILRRTCAP